jgi:hypothetical protein
LLLIGETELIPFATRRPTSLVIRVRRHSYWDREGIMETITNAVTEYLDKQQGSDRPLPPEVLKKAQPEGARRNKYSGMRPFDRLTPQQRLPLGEYEMWLEGCKKVNRQIWTEKQRQRSLNYEWDVVWVRDLDKGGMFVTNNISAILQHLSQHLPLKEYVLMYCDSRDIWDGLAYNGISVDFFSINETDYDRAISKLGERSSK